MDRTLLLISRLYGQDYKRIVLFCTPVAVDGYWSCWSAWSACDSSFKRQRTRLCNNPEPMNGGKPCKGDAEDEERCFISMFESQ